MATERPAISPLASYLAAAYALLVVYASLHPFAGWRDNGVPPFAFLEAAWPRYHTGFDLAANVLAYVPLGFLLVPALQARLGVAAAALVAALAGAALALGLETLQNFLPSRVPSNIDLACNGIGAMIGAAAGMNWGRELVDGGCLHRLRMRLVAPGHAADFGLVLLGLWLLAQLNPELLLFGTGDLRDLRALLDLPALPYSAERFAVIEAGVAAGGTLAAGLVCWSLLRLRSRALLAGMLLAPLAIKAFADAVLVNAAQFAHWVTPGNAAGLAIGSAVLLAATYLPPLAQRIVAALALLFATALVNLAPENPYLTAALAVWQQGHFLNFNGLTKLVSSLWPFAALPYLMLPRPRTGEHE
ncbi:MAG: VanZ family protein [Betaproteobacteria bacterium]|nr:VanZ family protein [Betaproteobacteria bacterium]